MKNQSKLTYTQIAREAGVSEATVSRVLNGDVRVDPERARRVHETVAKLGYKKNRAASALATGRTGLIAVIIDDDLSIFADPFWATVTSGVSRVLMENNMQTLLLVGASNNSDGNFSNYLDSSAVDGAIFFQVHDEEIVFQLAQEGLPVVMAGTPDIYLQFLHADTDNVGGAKQATQHLIDCGRKNIATITGEVAASAGAQRLAGFLQVHMNLGREVPPSMIAHGDYTHDSGFAAMNQLLDKNENVDAVFAANDLMAIGAMAAIQDRGLSVPGDIALVGFDDTIVAQTHRPQLTTIRQDIVGLGAAAAELMIAQLNGEEPKPRLLETSLVIRETT
jgi:DNA-binding LacI/PurR family transcriptional regulator